jgi:hypothetical protein
LWPIDYVNECFLKRSDHLQHRTIVYELSTLKNELRAREGLRERDRSANA